MSISPSRLIYIGWLLYLASLIVPWAGRPFSGWLLGWFWQALYLLSFVNYLASGGTEIRRIGSVAFAVSFLLMLSSPFLLFALKRGAHRLFSYVPLVGLVLAIFSVFCELFFLSPLPSPIWLFVFGHSLFLVAYGAISVGFLRQRAYQELGWRA